MFLTERITLLAHGTVSRSQTADCGKYLRTDGNVRLGSFSAMSCGDGARGFAVRSPFGSGHADVEGAILRLTSRYQADRVKTPVSSENGRVQSEFSRLSGF
jgi:hypothetical protein